MTEERKQRISITKLQRQTAAGAELIALCQTVTEDGTLADEEVAALRQWLSDNQAVDLPARDFLRQTVERIITDGKVTTDERQELFEAIEAVLPPDIRDLVRHKRKAVEKSAREKLKAEREAARAAAQEARLRSLPLQTWDFMVAGARYEGRPSVISQYARSGDLAYLARDPTNRYSRNAVEVRLSSGMQIGFVPEEDAVEMAPLLDAGNPHEAYIKKILTAGRSPIPVVVASVYSPNAERTSLVFQNQVPARLSPPRRAGCAATLAAVAFVLGVSAVAAFAWWG